MEQNDLREFRSNLSQFKNHDKETKRLYFELSGVPYVLYVTTHTAANLRNMGIPTTSPAFNVVLKKTNMLQKILVGVIERIEDKIVEGFEADTPNWNIESIQPAVTLHSAVLTEKRTMQDMEAFESALKLETGKRISQLTPALFVFCFIRMYATLPFSDLAEGPFAYKLLADIPKNHSELGIFVTWAFTKEKKEE